MAALRNISGAAFLTAFILSPRNIRHPYLLYTTGFIFSSKLLELVPGCSTLVITKKISAGKKEGKRTVPTFTPRGMEASYEVLGAETSSAASDAQIEEEDEVRGDVESFLKAQIIHGIISSAGFLMAVVGIWGDGA